MKEHCHFKYFILLSLTLQLTHEIFIKWNFICIMLTSIRRVVHLFQAYHSAAGRLLFAILLLSFALATVDGVNVSFTISIFYTLRRKLFRFPNEFVHCRNILCHWTWTNNRVHYVNEICLVNKKITSLNTSYNDKDSCTTTKIVDVIFKIVDGTIKFVNLIFGNPE